MVNLDHLGPDENESLMKWEKIAEDMKWGGISDLLLIDNIDTELQAANSEVDLFLMNYGSTRKEIYEQNLECLTDTFEKLINIYRDHLKENQNKFRLERSVLTIALGNASKTLLELLSQAKEERDAIERIKMGNDYKEIDIQKRKTKQFLNETEEWS